MKLKRRHVTLIEMMIVMFLIAIITGVIAYNFRGSLDEGKAFKSKVGIERLEDILNMRVTEYPSDLENIESNWREFVDQSQLVQDKKALKTDGWGQDYRVEVVNGVIKVSSAKYDEYKRKTKTMFDDGK